MIILVVISLFDLEINPEQRQRWNIYKSEREQRDGWRESNGKVKGSVPQFSVGKATNARVKDINISARNWPRGLIARRKHGWKAVEVGVGWKTGWKSHLETTRDDVKTERKLRLRFLVSSTKGPILTAKIWRRER